jgi:hypothetical protein
LRLFIRLKHQQPDASSRPQPQQQQQSIEQQNEQQQQRRRDASELHGQGDEEGKEGQGACKQCGERRS